MTVRPDWQPIAWPGVETGAYLVSDQGEVFSHHSGRVLKPMRTGYKASPSLQRCKVRLNSNPRVDVDVAHLVLTHFVAPRQPGEVAMHLDDNAENNALSNLRWGTQADNARDMALKVRGGNQRIHPRTRADIKRRREEGEKGIDLAKEYGVTQQRICGIFKGRR